MRAWLSSAAAEPLVREERWIDPAGQVPEVLERLGRVALKVREHRVGARLVLADQRVRQLQLHGERDELLLCAVVDVALDPPALLVLRCDEP